MIELYRTAKRNGEQLTQNLVAGVSQEIFGDKAVAYAVEIRGGRTTLVDVFEDYYSAPKRLGGMDDEDYLAYLGLNAAYTGEREELPLQARVQAFTLAATAVWEVAFMQTVRSHNSIETVDERLDYMYGYDAFVARAISLLPDHTALRHRLMVRQDFSQVLKDIVSGDITPDTVSELLTALNLALERVRFIPEKDDAQGLAAEIKVLRHFWQSYRGAGYPVAVPSTERGGSGRYRSNETHDIAMLKQRRDNSWITHVPIEVKNSEPREDTLKRYVHSHLAYIALDDTVRVTGDHRLRTSQTEQPAS